MATAAQLLDVARKDLGYHEVPVGSNKTKFNRWFYGSDTAAFWCAIWVSHKLHQVGIDGFKEDYTPYMTDKFKAAKVWRTDLSEIPAGAILMFNFDSDSGPEHTGFCVKDLGNGYVRTFEGNTSPSDAGSQSNGDGCYEKLRSKSLVIGYAVVVEDEGRFRVVGRKVTKKPVGSLIAIRKATITGRNRARRLVATLREKGYEASKKRVAA